MSVMLSCSLFLVGNGVSLLAGIPASTVDAIPNVRRQGPKLWRQKKQGGVTSLRISAPIVVSGLRLPEYAADTFRAK